MENIFKQTGMTWNKKLTESIFSWGKNKDDQGSSVRSLTKAKTNSEYIIKAVDTDDSEIQNFLFTLGCYAGEKITLISIIADQFVIVIKDARYSIDRDLAECIVI